MKLFLFFLLLFHSAVWAINPQAEGRKLAEKARPNPLNPEFDLMTQWERALATPPEEPVPVMERTLSSFEVSLICLSKRAAITVGSECLCQNGSTFHYTEDRVCHYDQLLEPINPPPPESYSETPAATPVAPPTVTAPTEVAPAVVVTPEAKKTLTPDCLSQLKVVLQDPQFKKEFETYVELQSKLSLLKLQRVWKIMQERGDLAEKAKIREQLLKIKKFEDSPTEAQDQAVLYFRYLINYSQKEVPPLLAADSLWQGLNAFQDLDFPEPMPSFTESPGFIGKANYLLARMGLTGDITPSEGNAAYRVRQGLWQKNVDALSGREQLLNEQDRVLISTLAKLGPHQNENVVLQKMLKFLQEGDLNPAPLYEFLRNPNNIDVMIKTFYRDLENQGIILLSKLRELIRSHCGVDDINLGSNACVVLQLSELLGASALNDLTHDTQSVAAKLLAVNPPTPEATLAQEQKNREQTAAPGAAAPATDPAATTPTDPAIPAPQAASTPDSSGITVEIEEVAGEKKALTMKLKVKLKKDNQELASLPAGLDLLWSARVQFATDATASESEANTNVLTSTALELKVKRSTRDYEIKVVMKGGAEAKFTVPKAEPGKQSETTEEEDDGLFAERLPKAQYDEELTLPPEEIGPIINPRALPAGPMPPCFMTNSCPMAPMMLPPNMFVF